MKALAGLAVLLAAIPCVRAEISACRRDGNRFALELSDGSGEIEWISPSSFRFARRWSRAGTPRAPMASEPIDIAFAESANGFEFRTRYIVVTLDKATAGFTAATRAGRQISSDLSLTRTAEGVRIEKKLDAEERFYGLGARATAKLNLRGARIRAGKPFLISSAGYGEFYRVPASYVFDLGAEKPDRRSVMLIGANRIEYYFYFGPEPKQILEEHLPAGGTVEEPVLAQFTVQDSKQLPASTSVLAAEREGSWDSLRESVYTLAHASLSAMLLPDFDLTPYLKAPAPLGTRAAQLAGVLPLVHAINPGDVSAALAAFRKRMVPIFLSYAHETRERGIPLIHPMPMQFPKDPAAAERADQFMVGDELLAAPVLSPEARRSVHLPMGQWTELRTNRQFKGRQTIEIEAGDELPLFAKNGSIVPFAPAFEAGPVELHYFPNIGGEFFLYEPGAAGYSQIHAGPAGDVLRLEIEAVADHGFEWIVHHAAPCRTIHTGKRELEAVQSRGALRPGTWFYDSATQNLHVRVAVKAGDDLILNVAPAAAGVIASR